LSVVDFLSSVCRISSLASSKTDLRELNLLLRADTLLNFLMDVNDYVYFLLPFALMSCGFNIRLVTPPSLSMFFDSLTIDTELQLITRHDEMNVIAILFIFIYKAYDYGF
jgi:hypothetical protein